MRAKFRKWLTDYNIEIYEPEVIVSCIDKYSEYAVHKNLAENSLWKYTDLDAFKSVYIRLIEAKPLRIVDWNRRKVFVFAGALYMRFLKEKPVVREAAVAAITEKKRMKPTTADLSSLQNAIDPDVAIAWLVKQPNANGTLYLKSVVRQYMSSIRSAPLKLRLSIDPIKRNVFACQTADELAQLWETFKTAPNYKKVNMITSGMFSAGMRCLLRYLQHLSEDTSIVEKTATLDIVQRIENLELEYVDQRNFGGALWVIGDLKLTDVMMKLRDSGFYFLFKKGGGRSSGYRDAWWYKPEYQSKPKEQQDTNLEITEESASQITTTRVDFAHPKRCAKTRPVSCTIKGKAVIPKKYNWSQLLVAITERFIEEGNRNLESLYSKPIYGSKTFFLPTKASFGACSLLSNGRWIYANYNPQIIVTIIKKLCQHCGVALDDVVISYVPNNSSPKKSTQAYVKPSASIDPKIDPKVVAQVTRVLSARFANGFKLDSPIELKRFRKKAEADLGEENTLSYEELTSNEELISYISACGTIFDGKVYPVSLETKNRIKGLAKKYFTDGGQVIFFSEFYTKNESWLFAASVVSQDMLIDILRELFPKLSFTLTYFGYTNASIFAALESEILRVWGDDVLLTYGQFAERLPYVPLKRIKFLLGQNSDFIWNSVEIFSHVSRVEITEEERQVIHKAAMRECYARGYVLITDLPFGKIEERNCEFSITAVHNAIYRICLSDQFDKKGKIVVRKGDVLDSFTIMKEYCRTVDKCSLDDLLAYGKDLTGESYHRTPMEAANAILVRIDKNTYVADKYVNFNTDIIDEAIGLFIKDDYLPLKSFTTFGAFPDCGQPWNLFVLESYCRRFSREFRFDAPIVNSRNAGAIIRKSCNMDYAEIMTDAVANADVILKDTNVGKFLYESGYIGKSTTKVNDIIEKAKAIRERMN